MKSEKARHRLYESFTLNSYIGIDGRAAFEAVELAEQEAEERMRNELTRWHNPKEELPEDKRTIAVKLKSDKGFDVQAGRYEGNEWRFTLNNHTIPATLIIGWREIYE